MKKICFGTPIESKRTNSLPPPPPQKLLSYEPPSFRISVALRVGGGRGMDIFWNYAFNNYITIGSPLTSSVGFALYVRQTHCQQGSQ